MKTKNFAAVIALSIYLLGVSAVSAAAVIPLSSGIKDQFYSIEWCSPHIARLVGATAGTPVCRTGLFQNVG